MTELKDEEREYYSLVKKVFDILAPFYDIVAAPLSRLRGRIVDFTGAEKGSRILDVATGTGKQAFAFAEKGYDVTGIDLSEAMLKVARRLSMPILHESLNFGWPRGALYIYSCILLSGRRLPD